jgi:hypothetical protein
MSDPTPPPAPLTPFGSLSQLLAWMAKRAAPLTGGVLGIAALFWADFRWEFSLPIGFASSSMLTALPSLAVIVCFATAILVVGIASPGLILTHPIASGGPTMASLLQTSLDETGHRINQHSSRVIGRYWFGMAVVSAISWTLVITGMTIWPDTEVSTGALAFAAVILAQTLGARWMVLRALPSAAITPSPDFYALLALSLLLQTVIAFWALYGLSRTLHHLVVADVMLRWMIFVAGMLMAATVQIVAALRMIKGWYPNLLKHIVCLGLAVLGLVAVIPPVAGRIASLALLSSATPGRPCTLLVFHRDSKDAPPPNDAILDGDHPGQSKPLRVVYPADAMLYVKESIEGPVYLIDLKAVSSTQACLKDEDSPAEAASSATKASPAGSASASPAPSP